MTRRSPWWTQDPGQGLVEYAVILALTSLCILLALLVLRNSIASPVHGTTNIIEAAGLSHGQPGTGSLCRGGEQARPAPTKPR